MIKDYWLLSEDPKPMVKKLEEFTSAGTVWSSNPILQAWVRNSISYFSLVLEPSAWDTSMIYMGEQGELVKMLVPMARSMIRQLLSICTKQKLNFTAIAENSNAEVLQVTKLANALAAEMVANQDLDQKYEFAMEQAFVVGAGFLMCTWRTDKGKEYAAGPSGEMLYDGDVHISTPTVWDVIYDFNIPHWDDLDWAMVRTIKNRYSLMAQFPEMEMELSRIDSIREWRGPFRSDYMAVNYDDFIYTYELYHKPTPALPNGRMTFFANSQTIFHDGPNEYGKIPLEQIKPEGLFQTGFGVPLFSQLLPCQEMLDTLISSIATNNSSYAVQNIAVPRGAALTVNDIKGMNFFTYTPVPGVPGGGKPEAIQLTQSAPETYKMIDLMQKYLENMSMISAALRGEPPAQVSSGTAIATLTSTALESINAYAKSGRRCLERTIMHGINSYRKFAKVEHMVRIAGKGIDVEERTFTGDELDPIRSVRITEANPLMQTLAGRLEIADKVLQTGLVTDVKEYFSILEGAPPKELWEDDASEDDLINKENDAMLNGQPVTAMPSDLHPYHMRRHKCLLNDPQIRQDPTRSQAITDHILDHYAQAKMQDPVFTAMMQTGKMPEGGIPPMAPPGSMGPPPSAPPPGGQNPIQDQNLPTARPAKPADDLLGREG